MTLVKIGNVYIDGKNQLSDMLLRDLQAIGYVIVHEVDNPNFDIVYDIDKFNQNMEEKIENERNSEYYDDGVCTEDN